MCDVLRSDGESVGARSEAIRNADLSGAGRRGTVPAEIDRWCPLQTGRQSTGGSRGPGSNQHQVTAMVASVVEGDADSGGRRGNDERLSLGPSMASGIPQKESDRVGAVLNVDRGKEPGLPQPVTVAFALVVFGFQVTERFSEPKGKQGNHGGDGGVRMDAYDRV